MPGLMSGDWKRSYGANCDTGTGESRRITHLPRSLRPSRQSSTLLKTWSMTCSMLGGLIGRATRWFMFGNARSSPSQRRIVPSELPSREAAGDGSDGYNDKARTRAEEAIDSPWGEKPGHLPTSTEILAWLADADLVVVSKRRLRWIDEIRDREERGAA